VRITTRVALGSGVVIALLAAVTAYQAGTISRLASMQRLLGEHTLPTTALALDLLAARDRLQDHVLKFAVTRDRGYAAAAAEAAAGFGRDLERLRALRPGGGEGRAIDRATRSWRAFPLSGAGEDEIVAELTAADPGQLPDRVAAPLEALRLDLLEVVAVARERTAARVGAAFEAADRARTLSAAALVVSVALAFAVTLVTVRTIHRRLDGLVGATRAIASGRFGHRVPSGGEDELSRLAEHFNAMGERLGELDRLKRDFLSHVSHEIKTPLVAMAETTRLLLDGVAGPLTARQHRLLELQSDNEGRLQEMISNLLDLSRMEAGAMEYRFAVPPPRAILEASIANFEALARDRGVGLELDAADTLPSVRCDRDRIFQVLHNLIDNAIRFSPSGGRITVSARPTPTGDLRMVVRDEGPGVPDDDRHRVFERFYQARGQRPGDRGGVGLGLAICREIVTAHGGRIWVEDAPGGGARFAFELKAVSEPELPTAQEGSR
jgi:two-component system sensor histidine kinase GlrK